jgi:hypothetical protein
MSPKLGVTACGLLELGHGPALADLDKKQRKLPTVIKKQRDLFFFFWVLFRS